jgi:hypothetical protein
VVLQVVLCFSDEALFLCLHEHSLLEYSKSPRSLQNQDSLGCEVMFFFHKRMFILIHDLTSLSFLACQTKFVHVFPASSVLAKVAVFHPIIYLCDMGNIKTKKLSGQPSVLSDESVGKIPGSMLQCPQDSLRKLAWQSGLSYGSVYKAVKVFKFHPYCVCHI